MSHYSSPDQFLELCIDPGRLFVRVDLRHKSITTGFKDWFSWHVDTVQQQIAQNIIHFIEPGGQVVGIKSFSLGVDLPGMVSDE
mgnify:FL=1